MSTRSRKLPSVLCQSKELSLRLQFISPKVKKLVTINDTLPFLSAKLLFECELLDEPSSTPEARVNADSGKGSRASFELVQQRRIVCCYWKH
ncbi:hypothetical protein B9Z55_021234 [Caenorhabditis nigoni]|uniref:Uncharacterized protein n=1 Tax=Caenorhabditis nigoni TaxID=1611254 RepID=A0A2G5T9J9_9PELO|nr:hypothetical protein B9Z55_017529 [Caenorhabditis nigoni]PIC29740.1 hypothetical protein B9Z55_021234 [Caenorhabditis nigoni]